jgi:hypothetical protein
MNAIAWLQQQWIAASGTLTGTGVAYILLCCQAGPVVNYISFSIQKYVAQ